MPHGTRAFFYRYSMASFSRPVIRLHPVFGAVSNRVPPGDTLSRFIGFGDKSQDNSKNYFELRALSFCFSPKGRGGMPLKAR